MSSPINDQTMKRILLLLNMTFFIFSCSPTFQVKQIDEKKGKLPTDTRLSPEDIKIDKSINLQKYNQFLFISKLGHSTGKYGDYIIGTLKQIGGFKQYYTQPDLERYVIQNNLTEKVTSISDYIGLSNLQKQIGDFLICETNIVYLGAYTYTFEFKIIDPSNADVLLDIEHKGFDWSGLDRPLFNPVFNYYIDWLNRDKNISQ